MQVPSLSPSPVLLEEPSRVWELHVVIFIGLYPNFLLG